MPIFTFAPPSLILFPFTYNSLQVTTPTARTEVLPDPTALAPVGFVVPMPTSPADVMRSFSEPSELKTKSELPSGLDPVVFLFPMCQSALSTLN